MVAFPASNNDETRSRKSHKMGSTSGDSTMVETSGDNIATDWASKEDWVREREVKSTLVDKY